MGFPRSLSFDGTPLFAERYQTYSSYAESIRPNQPCYSFRPRSIISTLRI
jgi:hypothetical protein